MTGDLAALRGEYLFYLGHLCGVSPREVDGLRVADFVTLCCGIDAYLKGVRDASE